MPGPPGPAGPPGIGLIGSKVICPARNNGLYIANECLKSHVGVQKDTVFFSCRVQLAEWDHLVPRVYLERASKDKRYRCKLSVAKSER